MKNPSFSALSLRFFSSFLVLLLALPSAAQELELVGVGSYNEFNKTNMVMRLDSVAPGADLSGLSTSAPISRFSFRFVEPKTPRRWTQFWTQNLSLNNSVASVTEHFGNLNSVTNAIQDTLEAGDLIAFELQRDNTLTLHLNGVELDSFSDNGFYRFLLTAVAGSIPPSSTLKSQLLGEDISDIDSNLALFENLTYNDSRVAYITEWITPEPEVVVPEPEIIAVAIEEDSTNPNQPTAEEIAAEEETARLAAEAEKREAEALAAAEAAAAEEAARQAALELVIANQQHIQSVLGKVYANIEYPRSAIRANREGVARVALTLNRDGSISKVELIEETKYKDLNNAALGSVEDAAPFDPIPKANEEDLAFIQFPIRFELTD